MHDKVRKGLTGETYGHGMITREEYVDVFVLKPPQGLPRVSDVTIMVPKPQLQHRILCTYLHQKITYSYDQTVQHDRKKVQ